MNTNPSANIDEAVLVTDKPPRDKFWRLIAILSIISIPFLVFLTLFFKNAYEENLRVIDQQAINAEEVEPNPIFSSSRQDSSYAEVMKYYIEATEEDAGEGAWPELAKQIEVAVGDDLLSNEEFDNIRHQHLMIKEEQARQLLIDADAGKAVVLDETVDWSNNPAIALKPYQQVLKAKIAVEAMIADPVNIRFIEKVDSVMEDGKLDGAEYQDVIITYNDIRATEDKNTLIAMTKRTL